MARDYFRYEPAQSYGRSRRKKTNFFGWAVAILLLTGFAFAAWLGSFYIFWQPERPQSYRILKKLHKIEPAKRFELTAAPAGEFLTSKQLYDRYIAMSPTELATVNAALVRNYIRNFQQVRGLVPYVVGRFNIMQARELTLNDVFLSGMVALTNAVDHGDAAALRQLHRHEGAGHVHARAAARFKSRRGLAALQRRRAQERGKTIR